MTVMKSHHFITNIRYDTDKDPPDYVCTLFYRATLGGTADHSPLMVDIGVEDTRENAENYLIKLHHFWVPKLQDESFKDLSEIQSKIWKDKAQMRRYPRDYLDRKQQK